MPLFRARSVDPDANQGEKEDASEDNEGDGNIECPS